MTTKLGLIRHLDLVLSFKNIILGWLRYILKYSWCGSTWDYRVRVDFVHRCLSIKHQYLKKNLVTRYRLQSAENSSVVAFRFTLLLALKMNTQQMPRWWREQQGKQSQQCKHCQRQPRTNYNQQWESQFSVFFLMTLCFPSALLQIVLKEVLFLLVLNSTALTIAYILYWTTLSMFIFMREFFVVFFCWMPTTCLIQPTQPGSEMNIIGQRLFPIGGLVHNIKHRTDCIRNVVVTM